MAESHSTGDTGNRERLTPSEKDIVLTESSDIGHDASAVSRWDANIAAIKTLKQIESENRQATSEEQKILSKYSGFGDSAFNPGFEHYYGRGNEAWERRRDELKEITTDDEYKAITGSRLNAFYTTPEVIRTMWKALDKLGVDKLKNPHVLEPSAGSGRFLGYEPENIASKSQRIAVELDSLTGRMLKQMYPKTEVYAGMGFEQAPIPKESVDVAISNVPFGNYPVFDPSFKKDKKKLTRSIHNYFFAKTLDELRPGGILAFITSHQTLDAPSTKPVRQELAKQADFIGAIRLPNNAFPDTQVVTDIIFMKKRMPDEKPGDNSWVDTDKVPYTVTSRYGDSFDTELSVNKYFIEHPEMVLGVPSGNGSMNPHSYREGEYTVEPKPNVSLSEQLSNSVQRLPGDIMVDAPHRERPRYGTMPTGQNAREGSRVIGEDGNLYINKYGTLVNANVTTAEEAKIKDILAIRDTAKRVVDIQIRAGADSELAPAQNELREQYSKFVTAHGPLSAPANAELLEGDPDAPFLKALERNDVKKKAKADLTEADNHLLKLLSGIPTALISPKDKNHTTTGHITQVG